MLKTVSSIVNAIGALNYKGTWNANTNTPTLTSGVGTKGDYYVVNVAGSTSLNGISNWGVGDWVTFNGSVWQRVEGGADLNGVNLSVSGTSALDGTVTFKDNLTQGTAGKGVNFSANTPAAGMSTQLLSWFEEGSWTPVTRTAGGTYTVQTGRYVRVGKLVTCFAYVAWSAHTGTGSPLEIEGLPFQSSATGLFPPGIINGTLTLAANESFNSYILTNVSYFKILRHNNITGTDAGYTIPASAGITLQFNYIAA